MIRITTIAAAAAIFTGLIAGHAHAQTAVELINAEQQQSASYATSPNFSDSMSEQRNLIQALKPIDASKFFGNESRLYVFAANKNKAVGLNMALNGDRTGLTVDRGAYVGDLHFGVGVRKGAVQMGIGYVHRTIKVEGESEQQNFVAFMVSIKAN